ERSSNTITDLMEGVELRLTGEGQVTVSVEQDTDDAVTKVKAVVDGLNGVLNQLNTVGKASSEEGARGPLTGDPLVRSLSMQLRGALSGVTGEGEYATLSGIGIELTRTGSITLDESKLRDALTSNPDAVASLLGKASSATDPRVDVTAVGRAEPGTYQLQVDT